MSRQLNKLTASQVKNAKCDGKIRKLADGGGLTLVVKGNAKYWWLRYRFAGNERTLSLGSYPHTTLAEARQARDTAKKLLAQGTDPAADRQLQADQRKEDNENTFSTVAKEWHDQKHALEVSESHAVRHWRRLELYTFPELAKRPIHEIQPPPKRSSGSGVYNITCDVEMLDIHNINAAYERVKQGDVKYRFVIDMATLKGNG